jgi:hypothetical protein
MTPHQQAAWYVEDAMRGYDMLDYTEGTKKQREIYLSHLHVEYYLYYPVLVLSLVLTFFETPLWCSNGDWFTFSSDAKSQCPTPDGSHTYFSKLPYLPKMWSVLAEIAIIAVLYYTIRWKLRFGKSSRDDHKSVDTFRMWVNLAMAADFVVFAVLNHILDINVQLRFSGFLRILLFFTSDVMLMACKNLIAMVPEFINVAVLLFGAVLFFAWVAAMALDDEEEENHEGDPINQGFESLPEAIYTLFEASTTQNYPDQMLPTFIKYRAWFLFFLVFMSLSVMVFLNLVLAVVYNQYNDSQSENMKTFFQNRAKNIGRSFKTIAKTGGDGVPRVMKDDFRKLIASLNRSPVVKYVAPGDFEQCWNTVDDDNSGTLEAQEYYDLTDILQFNFMRVQTGGFYDSLGVLKGCLPSKERLTNFVTEELDTVMNYILIINSVLVVFESLQDLSNMDTTSTDGMWAAVEFGFSILYVVELFLRLTVMGWLEYWEDTSNKFDFIVTVALFGVGVLWAIPFIYVADEVLRYFTILRLLRLLRLLASLPQFSFIMGCMWRMLIASKEAIGLLFGCMYLYAFAGVMMYGGLIYEGNEDLADTDYRDSGYDILCFNDMGLAMVSLYVNLITAFVPEFYEAGVAVFPVPAVAATYWVSFYIVGILMVFNVFASFIIDIFLALYEDQGEPDLAQQEETSVIQTDGSKATATYSGSDDIYQKLFLEKGSDEYNEVLDMFKKEAGVSED